jgi:predicted nucleotidyltransferase
LSRLVILFGSCSRGTNIEESDLDLLVVSGARDRILEAVARCSPKKRYGYTEIRPVIKSPSEWASLETSDPLFFGELQKGIVLFEKGVDESRL